MYTSSQIVRTPRRLARLAIDPVIVITVASLLLLGLVGVSSASIALAEKATGAPLYYLERQMMTALLGFVAGAVMLRIPIQFWKVSSFVLLAIALFGLALVLVPGLGVSVNGSQRWLRLGVINFQVSEAARVLLLTYFCGYLARREHEVRESLSGFFKPMVVLAIASALLLAEPDFGAAVVLVAVVLALVFLAGAPLRYFIIMTTTVVVAFVALAITSPYRMRRLTAFLDPWSDPFNSGFQLTQSLIAIGRGGLDGVGLGSSIQKLFYLPEAHTDFVFAVLSEELGLAGVLLIAGLFLILALRTLWISNLAARAGMKFHAYMAAAFAIWLAMQALVNICVNLGLLPTKGLTLPFMSYGRSSLLVALAWVGIVLRVRHEVVGVESATFKEIAR